MSETTWAMIREAIERVLSGAARRQDLDLYEARISVYRVGTQTRCDILPPK